MADEEFGLELVDAEGEEPSGEALADLAALAEAEALAGEARTEPACRCPGGSRERRW